MGEIVLKEEISGGIGMKGLQEWKNKNQGSHARIPYFIGNLSEEGEVSYESPG